MKYFLFTVLLLVIAVKVFADETPVSPAQGQPWCSGEITVGQVGITCKSADIQGHQLQGKNPTGDKCPGGVVDENYLFDLDGSKIFIGCWGIKN
jgi:hypothetical protein